MCIARAAGMVVVMILSPVMPRPAAAEPVRVVSVLSPSSSIRPITASLEPERILPQQDAGPAADASVALPMLVALAPADLVPEAAFDGDAPIVAKALREPLTVLVSLKDQKLHVYRGLERIETARVSSGKKGYETLTGVFGILQKKREHYSNLYDNAPMPYMQRLTRSGTALHAGPVPNYPASHGCIRMPRKFASRLFRMTEIGGKVAMMNGRMVAPKPITHPALFEIAPANLSAAALAGRGVRATAQVLADVSFGAAFDPSREDGPLHMLITRRERRDIAKTVQEILAAMGYLPPQDNFVGYLGEGTKKAIEAFEKDNGLPPTGRFTDAIAAKIYEAGGQGPLPDAYLFVRKGFSRIGQVPVTLENPRKPLGTHLFTYTPTSGGGAPQWIGISLEGENSKAVLDRIAIPDDMRADVSQALTAGATVIVADKGMHSSVLPEGDDFIVRTNDSPKSNPQAVAAKKSAAKPKQKAKKKKVRQRSVRTRPVKRKKGRRLFSRRR